MSKPSVSSSSWHPNATTVGSRPAVVDWVKVQVDRLRSAPYLVLTSALILTVLANICMGAVSVSPAQIISIVAHHVRALMSDSAIFGPIGSIFSDNVRVREILDPLSVPVDWMMSHFEAAYTRQEDAVVWAIRIPRTLLGLIIGAGLGVSGAAMQGMFRNPLADPGLIGVSTGAAFGAVLAIVLEISIFGVWTLPVSAFVFGVIGTSIAYLISRQDGRTEIITLILAGVALNAIAGAAVGLLISIANDQQLRSVTFWTLGSLGGSRWSHVGIVGIVTVIGIALVMRCRETLNLFVLGEREARHLGVDVERTRIELILVTASMTGVAVAFAGAIGFVGLVVPHLIRLWIGPDHQHLIPFSAIGGATLLLADLVSRTVAAPSEFPIGVTMSLVGGPFFIWLLLRTRKQHGGWG